MFVAVVQPLTVPETESFSLGVTAKHEDEAHKHKNEH